MARHADGPPSGRVGFGYRDAQKAGLPWEAIQPRSVTAINEELREKRAERQELQAELMQLLHDHPAVKERAAQLLSLRWSIPDVLSQVRREAAEYRYRREALAKSKRR